MDESGRLQGVTGSLLRESLSRQSTQLGVDEREELLGIGPSRADGVQHLSDGTRGSWRGRLRLRSDRGHASSIAVIVTRNFRLSHDTIVAEPSDEFLVRKVACSVENSLSVPCLSR